MVPILLLHISLALPATGLSTDARRAAIEEMTAIWSANGVAIAAAPGELPADATHLRVVIEPRRSSLGPSWGGPLGSIRFDEAGIPVPVITLYLSALVEMIGRANIPGAGGDSSPAILRDRAIGRAVGRVLAHELGHFLLRSRWHGQFGLMRPVHTVTDLVGPERASFALSAPDAARLAIVTSSATTGSATANCLGAGR
jgi:hypothetical protein